MMIAPDSALRQKRNLLLLVFTATLFVLRFVHLSADFPNHCRWSDDWARFTDEGWYAAGAIHKALLGRWLLPADFNPMVTIPGWPVLLHLLFHFTGVSIVASRAADAVFGILAAFLLDALVARTHPGWRVMTLTLVASSPILFTFSRLALIEVPMMAFVLAAVLTVPTHGQRLVLRSLLAGCLMVFAMFIKSSAIFLLPAVCVYSLQQQRLAGNRRAWLAALLPAAVFVAVMALYTAVVVLPHSADFHTLSVQNTFTLQWRSLSKLLRALYRTFTWVDPLLYPLAVFAVVAGVVRFRDTMARSPLFLFSVLWAAGAIAFCVLHLDAGPRYFVLMVVPVVVLVAVLLERLEAEANRLPYRLAAAVVACATLLNAWYIVRLMLRPTYTLRDACAGIRETIAASGDPHPLVFGHGAEETTFFTHIEAVDDLGSITPRAKLDLYHPGWAVLWSNDTDLLSKPPVTEAYGVTLVHSWAVMDDPLRSHLVLYRLRKQ